MSEERNNVSPEKTEQELKNLEGLKSDTTAYVKKLDSSLESIGNELSKLNDDIDAKEKQRQL